MKTVEYLWLCVGILLLGACQSAQDAPAAATSTEETTTKSQYTFLIKNLSDEEYPDNPDIGFRAGNYQSNYFTTGNLTAGKAPFVWSFTFHAKDGNTFELPELNISEFIPTIPISVKADDYLSYIACINQEWNRNQVRFQPTEFECTTPEIVRMDMARNCLNAYLWEVILYIQEDQKTVPYAHGWFDFPKDLYAQLFEAKNQLPFERYQKPLENWVDPANQPVNFTYLRTVVDTLNISYRDLSDSMYPLEGARKKKRKEVIAPANFTHMRDLQTDSARFATFTPPGFYNKKDPRHTELGRIHQLKDLKMYHIKCGDTTQKLQELALQFQHKNQEQRITQFVLGGIDLATIPVLEETAVNKGWKSSMGIGNHPFYETYVEQLAHQAATSPYYALLLDGKGNWLDSHKVGIDGPILHFSDPARKTLHLWLLSFERHALVGHYEIKLRE
ncbi:MAG: hypothetical protein AAF738_01085 [Bacteroidota bacterium]